MFSLKVRGKFDAAHHLKGYEGKCQYVHGHTWKYELMITGLKLDHLGMLIDFQVVKEWMRDEIEGYLDHVDLNACGMFSEINPTAENIAKWIYDKLKHWGEAFGVRLDYVEVWESDNCSVRYRDETV